VKRLRESKDHVECQIAEEIEEIMETAAPAVVTTEQLNALRRFDVTGDDSFEEIENGDYVKYADVVALLANLSL
jgi:hypothetical protein